jgi:hypothetical protein
MARAQPAAGRIPRRARPLRSTLDKITSLSVADRALFAEAMMALAVAAVTIAVLPFRHVARSAGTRQPGPASDPDTVARVRRAVVACARRAPWRALCFEQGLAATWMLRRRGLPAVLHYGVATTKSELKAHVWVRSGDLDVVGCENSGEFAEIARFPVSAS